MSVVVFDTCKNTNILKTSATTKEVISEIWVPKAKAQLVYTCLYESFKRKERGKFL